MNRTDVDELKRVCPLPVLMHRIGLGKFAKKSCSSPFREDKNPSWGIFKHDGNWFFKDQATGETGHEITLLARWKGLDEKRDFQTILKIYAELAGVPLNQTLPTGAETPHFSWSECVSSFDEFKQKELSEWRGYSPDFCAWLVSEKQIGLYCGNWALPVNGEAGAVIAAHYRLPDGSWRYAPKGISIKPLQFGDIAKAANLFVFESPWDAFAVMDKLRWHKPNGIPNTAIIITRGANNGRLIVGLFGPQVTVYAFKQNDETKHGKNAAEGWLTEVCRYSCCKVFTVATPPGHKDINDWTRAGATAGEIMAAIQGAQLVQGVSGEWKGGETVEMVESVSEAPELTGSVSTSSTFSTAKHKLDEAIFPTGSWLGRYMDYARKREESADSYLLGAILPVIAVALARRVWVPWGDRKVFPNLFVMLAGKPGDRKSSAINLAERFARVVIDKKHFLPDAMSAEALFDEYDEKQGGSPDKILIADDANPFLGMLQKSNHGERVGQRLLNLYDCKCLAESFRRNKETGAGQARRFVDVTSTSMVLGATFNICQFHGHEIRSGLQRRFLYYLAEGHGRFIAVPAPSDQMEFLALCRRLATLTKLAGLEFQLSPVASELWLEFQMENRRRLLNEGHGAGSDAYLARLNGQPNHVQKLAMIFQAVSWAEVSTAPEGLIEASTLQAAIDHTELCLFAAQTLDSIANRVQIQQDADLLLAKIVNDFGDKNVKGLIQLTRTDLTSTYAHHSGRNGALTANDLYLRLIPDLMRRGKAKEVPRPGRQSAFAFVGEDA